ncbi:recombinase family protein [Corynebacterium freneyi]
MVSTTSPPGQRVAYVRVSSAGQNIARQREMIGAVDAEFIDRVSGARRTDRTELARALAYVRAGDSLIVASIDRLARSTADLLSIIEEAQGKGVGVHFIKENLHFSPGATDPRDRLMLGIMGALAEFEREIIRERQAEGIAIAKAEGRYRGAPRVMNDAMIAEARRRIAAGETKAAVAADLGVSRMTLYRYLRAHQADPAGR